MTTEPTPTTESTPTRRWRNLGWYVLLTALSILVLFPVYMTFIRAISGGAASLFQKKPSLLPVATDWSSFIDAFREGNLGAPLLRSLLVTAIIVVAQTVTSTMAAYAFAFLEFPLKKVLFALIMGTLLLPIEVTLIANVQTMFDLDLINVTDPTFGRTLTALTIPFLATALGVFLIRQGFLGIPHDLLDAARLDGYSDMAFLWKIAVPVTRPIVGSFIVISFLGAYNQYVWPRFAVKSNDYDTIQIALRNFLTDNPNQLNWGFAAALIAAVPVLVLLLVFQRQLVRGLTAGAVK
ncbi:MAG: carbohydrate ABC transporter permease [Microthrixaceae bacterium]|nr:carbohydrate ABC transporter permease [Microthrixaceae bacterium]